jgi:hypothetical protein
MRRRNGWSEPCIEGAGKKKTKKTTSGRYTIQKLQQKMGDSYLSNHGRKAIFLI